MSAANQTQRESAAINPASNVQRGSRVTLRGIAVVLVLCALAVTGYMSFQKLTNQQLQCAESGVFNCSLLENSAWAELTLSPSIRIPTALLGFLTHVTLLTILLLETRIGLLRDWGKVMMFGITLFGFLYHCYLTFYVSITVFGALCPYCLTAHVIMTLLLIISGIRLYQSFRAPQPDAA